MSRPARRRAAQNSGMPGFTRNSPTNRGWFKPGNPWAIPKGKTLNPGGRPKILSDAAKEFLAFTDEKGVTNAAKIIAAQGRKAIESEDTSAVKELRQMTEGDKIVGWQDELITLLREGRVTPADLIAELGADIAEPIIIASGARGTGTLQIKAEGVQPE